MNEFDELARNPALAAAVAAAAEEQGVATMRSLGTQWAVFWQALRLGGVPDRVARRMTERAQSASLQAMLLDKQILLARAEHER